MEVLKTRQDFKKASRVYTNKSEVIETNLKRLLFYKRGMMGDNINQVMIGPLAATLSKKRDTRFSNTRATISEYEIEIAGNDIAIIVDHKVEYFLQKLDANLDNTDSALDIIYRTFYQKLSKSEYSFCNHMLSGLTSKRYPLAILMGFLTASFPWKEKLPSRNTFYDEVKALAKQEYTTTEVTSLLSGLE